jgi:HRAS-like suppressor 3
MVLVRPKVACYPATNPSAAISNEVAMSSAKLLFRTQSLKPGTELIVDRLGYRHHGIYVGDGLVIHYAGWVSYSRGLIETVTVGDFAGRCPVRVGRVPCESQHGNDIVRRARSRLGERCYDVLRNNCEHFCNWCQVGESRSTQVDLLLQRMERMIRLVRSMPLRLSTCLKPTVVR